ncbi:MAG: glutamate--tRNA ligase [Methanobrevibacter sp.]|jgi:glutamyl-tRNA synthetase|nr:glutamate--tRNA ligase [Candidatus Methanovirga basalitermitum]
MNDLEKIVYEHGLLNAKKHKGKANPGAVVGSIMSTHSELRSKAKEIGQIANSIVKNINEINIENQEIEIANLGIKTTEKKKKTEKGLPDLKNVDGMVVMRFAPNPSGPLHIGHARAVVPNSEYVKKYNGKLMLRIEDTDPKRIYEPAYKMIEEDIKWLTIEIDDTVVYQSDRFPIYYEYAEKLIKLSKAYVCTCTKDKFKRLKDESKPCPCRNLSVEENMELWNEFPEMGVGQAVLRVKTDLSHKNPAIRDWVAMRIVDEKHPRLGDKYRVYPMMNFSVAIDDHLMEITHVLRGKDHLANSEKQKYLYEHLNWKVPEFIHYGRLKMEDMALSTSKAFEGIEDGTYTGWDDPRLGTLRAMGRRGIQAKTIIDLMLEIGVKMSDSSISWKKIYGLNRKILEKFTNRYFFVSNPVKIQIKSNKKFSQNNSLKIKRPLHPDFLERGDRELSFNGEVYIPMEDLKDGLLRLMDTINITIFNGQATFHSSSFEQAREEKAKIIQWVPVNENINAEIVMSDNSIIKGLCEVAVRDLNVGDIVQFERFGFARLDKKEKDKLIFYFAHK